MIDLADLLDAGESSGTIHLSGFGSGDTITMSDDGGKLDGADASQLATYLGNAMQSGDTVTLASDGSKLTVGIDYASDEDNIANITDSFTYL